MRVQEDGSEKKTYVNIETYQVYDICYFCCIHQHLLSVLSVFFHLFADFIDKHISLSAETKDFNISEETKRNMRGEVKKNVHRSNANSI